MAESPLVSIVIVNWNGSHHLRIALPSLSQQSYSPLEVLVVDNGSSDESRQSVEAAQATWIGLPRNIGLAAACNEGSRRARGNYLVFLNNDMRFPRDFISFLTKALIEDENAFATDARQLNWDGTEEIHLATRLRKRTLIGSYLRPGFLPLLDSIQEPSFDPVPVFQACSAAMAVRRNKFESLNGFDERLPVSWEDTEICWRAWLRGWPTLFVPEAVCWHRVGGSVRDNPGGAEARFRGIVGGRILFASKHLPFSYALHTWLVSFLGIVKDMLGTHFHGASTKMKVMAEYVRALPNLLRERHRLYHSAAITPSGHLHRMLGIGHPSSVKHQQTA